MGCTDCGRKGGCEARKQGASNAVADALARLYPSGRWGERRDSIGGGVPPETSAALADRAAAALGALALFRAGGADELCDYVYVLCVGRQPSALEVREGTAEPGPEPLVTTELHLRVVLSTVAPFAAVQQVSLTMEPVGDDLLVSERPRAGVFDPVLLPRMQKLVALLAALGVRHLDFGEITAAPDGYDAADYRERYGAEPAIANYLFYPQPCTAITTTVVRARSGRVPTEHAPSL